MSDQPDREDAPDQNTQEPQPRADLSPAARRALVEAEARRRAEEPANRPREIGGRGGPEPTRYGDWEKDGIAHDF